MTAGEDETEAIVLDAVVVQRFGFVGNRLDLLGHVLHRVEPRMAAYAVDGLEAAGGHKPRARICGHAIARPLLERRPERVVQGFLGEIEITEQADQCGEDATRLRAINGFRLFAHVRNRVLVHWSIFVLRTPVFALGAALRAHWSIFVLRTSGEV
jgi:hypothetical protein